MTEVRDISRFVSMNREESAGKEYLISLSGHRRWTLMPLLLIVCTIMTVIVPIVLLIYFALRKLKTVRGVAVITKDRVIYYEHCDHPTENFHNLRQMNIADIAAVKLYIKKSLMTHMFALTIWSPSTLVVALGAKGGFWGRIFGGDKEPGPDADEFVQDLSARVTRMRLVKASESSAAGSRLSSSRQYY